MERIKIDVRIGESLGNMHWLLNREYLFEKARRSRADNTKEFVVYALFNGIELIHTDTPDEISIKVTGKTIAELEAAHKTLVENHERNEEKICQLIDKYKSAARGIIPKGKLKMWDEIVSRLRFNNLYGGKDLDKCLEIIKVLNEDKSENERFATCKKIFRDAGHLGWNGWIVLLILSNLHPDGVTLGHFIISTKYV